MQFHENGFRPGDPRVHPAADIRKDPSKVDVLIVGAGPAGLTLAAQLAAFPSISTRIVERKSGPMQLGQADGVACRTIEMFQTFGFAERVIQEAYGVNETVFWSPDPNAPKNIMRTGRIQDVEDDVSEMPHVILNQARIHDYFLEVMANAPTRLAPDYDRAFEWLSIDRLAEYPVRATINTPTGEEMVAAKYVVGCDGARSAVREAIGLRLSGDSANQAWGVIDALVDTDFPDFRYKSVVRSATEGTALIIPREGGYLIRIYIELDKLAESERVHDRHISATDLIAAANRIFRPYTFDAKEIVWWSVYEIGQRLTDRFHDSDKDPRVFIAGDACHTHSPKAGQGMNVSMGDAFNLGWKLAVVLRGQAHPKLLRTYSEERQAVAADLIAFDRHWAKRFSERPSSAAEAPLEFQDYFSEHGRYTAGVAIRYAPNLITGAGNHASLAEGFPPGMRFHSAPVVRVWDGKPTELGHVAKADGRWRLYLFADRAAAEDRQSPHWRLCDLLSADASPLFANPEGDKDTDPAIDLCAIFQHHHHNIDVAATHPILTPRQGRYALKNTEKIFSPDLRFGPDIFDLRRIDRDAGCMILVRPDQYVTDMLPLTAGAELVEFFRRFEGARSIVGT